MKNISRNYLMTLALLLSFSATAQKTDYVVTTSFDTIYVDKITVSDFNIKTTSAGKKKKFTVDEIISYYEAKDNLYFERIANQKEIKEITNADRYDYKRMETYHIEAYDKRVKYQFLERLTHGKVKLFREVAKGMSGASGSPGQAGYIPAIGYENKTYSIAIDDAKLEKIKKNCDGQYFKDILKSDKNNCSLELTSELYDLLLLYLYGNNEITTKLNNLYTSKPIAKEKQIVDLINEYNRWVKLNK